MTIQAVRVSLLVAATESDFAEDSLLSKVDKIVVVVKRTEDFKINLKFFTVATFASSD